MVEPLGQIENVSELTKQKSPKHVSMSSAPASRCGSREWSRSGLFIMVLVGSLRRNS
ncbi:hypothetical protein GTQ43_38530 [Nostoc sp. KVJ3]|uniref:hypothetical protein n=1 Tax=Nostoc sp. KVJ3 TaxID=457945 RepID=UPI00223A668D|nr:hypothetical protein [Nostoc sp. KVJ3]